MSIWGRAKTKAEELLGRAEQVYGESHGDDAATVAGEALVGEAEAEEEEERRARRARQEGHEGHADPH